MGHLLQSLSTFTCLSCGGVRSSSEFLFQYITTVTPTWGLLCESCREIKLRAVWYKSRGYVSSADLRTRHEARVFAPNAVEKTFETKQLLLCRFNEEMLEWTRTSGGLEALRLLFDLPEWFSCGSCKDLVHPWDFTQPLPISTYSHCVACYRSVACSAVTHAQKRKFLRWDYSVYRQYRQDPGTLQKLLYNLDARYNSWKE